MGSVVRSESPFQALGLPETATPEEVRAAWHKLASIHHPDHNGDAEKFKVLRHAYTAALAWAEQAKPCETCHGTGKVKVRSGFVALDLPCSVCKGVGKIL